MYGSHDGGSQAPVFLFNAGCPRRELPYVAPLLSSCQSNGSHYGDSPVPVFINAGCLAGDCFVPLLCRRHAKLTARTAVTPRHLLPLEVVRSLWMTPKRRHSGSRTETSRRPSLGGSSSPRYLFAPSPGVFLLEPASPPEAFVQVFELFQLSFGGSEPFLWSFREPSEDGLLILVGGFWLVFERVFC